MLRLKKERIRRGWSLVEVCTRTRIAPETLSRLENGKLFPYPGWKKRLAEAFEIPAKELFEEVPDGE